MDKNLEDSRIGFMRFDYSICIGIQSSAGKAPSIQELGGRNSEMDLFSSRRILVSSSQYPCEGFVGYKTEITGGSPSGRELGEQGRPSVDRSMLSNFGQSGLEPPSDRNRFPENPSATAMDASGGVERKRGPAEPLQAKVGISPESSFPPVLAEGLRPISAPVPS